MSILEKLLNIQTELNAPKNQRNNFGNYNYRNCEDILEALKPLLKENKCIIKLQDKIVNINNRYYVEATAELKDIESEGIESCTAYAREEETKKGMDGSQVTGASSSYARKYALNGLFAIDDNKDSDSTNTHGKTENKAVDKLLSDKQVKRLYALASVAGVTEEQVKSVVKKDYGLDSVSKLNKKQYDTICTRLERKGE